jgi:hypothetical protein
MSWSGRTRRCRDNIWAESRARKDAGGQNKVEGEIVKSGRGISKFDIGG